MNSEFNWTPGATVAELSPGMDGRVARVAGDDAMTIRLLEMGFVPGTRVEVRKLAPLGDPMELRLRGYHVSVRRVEARRIELAPPEGSKGATGGLA